MILHRIMILFMLEYNADVTLKATFELKVWMHHYYENWKFDSAC